MESAPAVFAAAERERVDVPVLGCAALSRVAAGFAAARFAGAAVPFGAVAAAVSLLRERCAGARSGPPEPDAAARAPRDSLDTAADTGVLALCAAEAAARSEVRGVFLAAM